MLHGLPTLEYHFIKMVRKKKNKKSFYLLFSKILMTIPERKGRSKNIYELLYSWLSFQSSENEAAKLKTVEGPLHSGCAFLLDLILNTCTLKISQELKIRVSFDSDNAFP